MAETALLRNTHSICCAQLWPWGNAPLAQHWKNIEAHTHFCIITHTPAHAIMIKNKNTVQITESFTHSQKLESPLGCESSWPAPATAHMALIYEQWPRSTTGWVSFLTVGGDSTHVKWHVPRGAMGVRRKNREVLWVILNKNILALCSGWRKWC